MARVALISALSASTLPYLDEAWGHVRALRVPDDVELSWHIQHDGDCPAVTRPWFEEDWVRYAHNGRHLGPAGTRMQAVIDADVDVVWSYDPDDILDPEALSRLWSGLSSESGVAWAAGAWPKLLEDGTVDPFRVPEHTGVVEPGFIAGEIQRRGTTPFNMNPVMILRDALLEVGGWPALPEWEDTVLLLLVSARHRGFVTQERIGLYRVHARSLTSGAVFQEGKPRMYGFIHAVAACQPDT